MTQSWEYVSHSPEQTLRLGKCLGELLFPGSILALKGPLGAGKTMLTQGIAKGLQIADPHQVTSPTFTLLQEYQARLPIYHFDTYRLKQLQDFEDLGAFEYFAGQGVCLIEWADRIKPLLPLEHLEVDIVPQDTQCRCIRLTASGKSYVELLRMIKHILVSPA